MRADVRIPIRLRLGCEIHRKRRYFLALLDPECELLGVGVHAGAALFEKAAHG
jgi:hypothetical protein